MNSLRVGAGILLMVTGLLLLAAAAALDMARVRGTTWAERPLLLAPLAVSLLLGGAAVARPS